MRQSTHVSTHHSGRSAWPVRYQLLLGVNAVLVLGLFLLLVLDYRSETRERMRDKISSLSDEARIVLPAVLRLRHHGIQSVQEYLDAACGTMQDTTSPGHHIAAALGKEVLQAKSHHRASQAFFDAIRSATADPNRIGSYEGTAFVVGHAEQDGVGIYVAESLLNLMATIRQQALKRSLLISLLGLLATSVTDLILWRLVTRPVHQLVGAVRSIARGQLGSEVGRYRSMEFSFLAEEIGAMSQSLDQVERQRRRQIDKAQRIQQSLMPRDFVAPGWEIACGYQPAEDVGGDYFDLIIRNGALVACIADYSGHGVPAAMGAAMIKTLFETTARNWASPAQMLAEINRSLVQMSLSEDFASMVIVVLESQSGKLTYASAGHEPTFLMRPGAEVIVLPSTGTVLGIDPGATWEAAELSISANDRLVLITDGCTEARSPAGGMPGRQGVLSWLLAARGQDPHAMAQAVLNQVTRWRETSPQSDDVALLVLQATQSTPLRTQTSPQLMNDLGLGISN